MLRQDSSRIDPNPDESRPDPEQQSVRSGSASVDIQRELNRLEEAILDSPRIPFSRRTLIDEEQILDRLDTIRLNLPTAFAEAEELIRRKEEIVLEAQQYANEIIEAAERQAAGILDEMGIVRQAKAEADRIRQQVQLDCDAAQQQTVEEIEQLRSQAQQELEEMRSRAIAECEAIEVGADDYADRVLRNIEHQLGDMMRVIRNGRVQLQQESQTYSVRQQGGEPQSPPPGQHPPKRR
jgi:cell division septum initiation protein DivIVA